MQAQVRKELKKDSIQSFFRDDLETNKTDGMTNESPHLTNKNSSMLSYLKGRDVSLPSIYSPSSPLATIDENLFR